MNLHILPAGPISTNAYLLADPKLGEAVLIDAPEGIWEAVEPVLAREGCRLGELWITHGHWDHIQGAAEVVRRTGAKVRAHKADRMLLENPRVMSSFSGVDRLEPIKVDAWVGQGDVLAALGTSAEVRHVPGHCPGNVLFYFREAGSAFVGDAIFNGSVGRVDIPGGDFAVLERSIRTQIYTLPDATAIYPGHGPETTVRAEKDDNPYVPG